MKLMFVGFVSGEGGAERVFINLSNEMSNRKHDVYLVSIALDHPKYHIDKSVTYKLIADHGHSKISRLINRYCRLREYIKEINPDLIICNMCHPAYLCAFMGRDIAAKTIYAERCDPCSPLYNTLSRIIRYISFKRLRGFVFQSKAAQSCFDNNIQRRAKVIYNTIDTRFDKCVDVTCVEKRIVSVGRLHKQKNHALLIEAFAMLPESKKEYILEIYGDGPLREKLQNKIDTMGLSNRVFLRGFCNDVHKRIVNATMFVLTSDYEGMPNALLEAMALGLPCISTDYSPGSIKEFIFDGENGLIVPRGDARALMSAMERILDNNSLRYKICQHALEIRDQLAPSRIYDEWERFFIQLVDSNAH